MNLGAIIGRLERGEHIDEHDHPIVTTEAGNPIFAGRVRTHLMSDSAYGPTTWRKAEGLRVSKVPRKDSHSARVREFVTNTTRPLSALSISELLVADYKTTLTVCREMHNLRLVERFGERRHYLYAKKGTPAP